MARKKKAIPQDIRIKIYNEFDTCAICGKVGIKDCSDGIAFEYIGYADWDCTRPNPVRFEIDHIMPEFLGGETVEENLQLLCRKCNRSKGYKYGNR